MSENGDFPATAAKQTALHAFHQKHQARFVEFAGYDMPVQYKDGVLKEHLHTRSSAGLFDVSHMGQILLTPKNGKLEDAALALEGLVPVDILALKAGRQRYALFTNDDGGVLDDLMVANRGDHLMLIVNAACKSSDLAHLRKHLSSRCDIDFLHDRALLALQGPKAEEVLAALVPQAATMRFMDVQEMTIEGVPCVVSRSGYTGEDGYEISLPNSHAESLAEALLNDPSVAPIGLGARDSLRLEAGLCLYGSDMDTETTPVDAALDWAIQRTRRAGGARAGGFPGAARIIGQLTNGSDQRRVGLLPEGRAPVRGGARLYADAETTEPLGRVTSGGFGPSVGAPIAMGFVATAHAQRGVKLYADVRGKRLPVSVSDTPFHPHRYKRN